MTKKISEDLSVAAQIEPEVVADLAAQGFKSIICNRPDGESADQPGFDEVAAAATAAGLQTRYIPVTVGRFGDGDVAAFAEALSELPKPVLAYCRSGTRSAMLWAMAQAGQLPADAIITAARNAGYDVTSVVSRIARDGAVDKV